MGFRKTSEAPIKKVFCSCGTELQNGVCPKCAKEKQEKKKESDEDKG